MTESSSRGLPGRGAAPTILIVDDDEDMRALTRAILEPSGYLVRDVESGVGLMQCLQGEPPDAILLDIMMSWMTGLELCQALKANERFRHVPVCFVSSRSGPAEIERAMGCGAADYFVKPVDWDRLLQRLGELTGPPART